MTETETTTDEFAEWLEQQDWVDAVDNDDDGLVAITVPEGRSMGFFQRDTILERGWVVLGVFVGDSQATVVYEQIPELDYGDEETPVRAD